MKRLSVTYFAQVSIIRLNRLFGNYQTTTCSDYLLRIEFVRSMKSLKHLYNSKKKRGGKLPPSTIDSGCTVSLYGLTRNFGLA